MQTTLHKAVKIGNVEQVKSMLQSGRDVNQRNIYGRTPLGVAIQYNQKEIAQLLREHGGKE